MSSASMSLPSPLDQRDMRSASKPFKRDKDHDAKWSNGQRPSAGVHLKWDGTAIMLTGGSDSQRAKVRPSKINSYAMSEHKTRANVNPKNSPSHSYELGRSYGRVNRAVNAHFDARDDALSRSLLELAPEQSRRDPIANAEALYSYDNAGPSPNEYGRKVGLEGLVDKAEQKWASEQTEKMVRGEYEVLDHEGETTTLKKGKRSPKQKAVKNQPAVLKDVEDVDGFELI